MTSELEQEFFKVFGIEPIEYRKNVPCLNFLSNGICNITDERCNPSKCNEYRPDKTSRLWRDFMEVYPEITDHKLLEMICITNEFISMFNWKQIKYISTFEFETLKENILKDLIWILNNECNDITAKQLKYQIQQLFKGEE